MTIRELIKLLEDHESTEGNQLVFIGVNSGMMIAKEAQAVRGFQVPLGPDEIKRVCIIASK